MSLVTCANVGRDLTSWLQDASLEEREDLCEALACTGEFLTENTNSVTLSGDGSADSPLTAELNVSDEPGNRLEVTSEGVFLPSELPEFSAADEGKKLVIVDGVPEWQEDGPCLVEVIYGSTTLAPEDNGTLAVVSGGTLTAPTSLPIGFRIDIEGPATVVTSGSGGSIVSVDGNTKVVAFAGATLIKTSATEFWLAGMLEA